MEANNEINYSNISVGDSVKFLEEHKPDLFSTETGEVVKNNISEEFLYVQKYPDIRRVDYTEVIKIEDTVKPSDINEAESQFKPLLQVDPLVFEGKSELDLKMKEILLRELELKTQENINQFIEKYLLIEDANNQIEDE